MAVVAKYTCRERDLYAICQLAWNSCLANLPAFALFSGLYVAGFIALRLAAVAAAEALPDFQMRNADQQHKRGLLEATNTRALNMWKQLRQYIKYCFPEVDWDIYLDAAGQGYYSSALHGSWNSMRVMLESAINFVTIHSAALLAGNMPASFPAALNAMLTQFLSDWLAYESARQATPLARDEKVTANNAIFTDVMTMFDDAGTLGFSDTLMKEFTFSHLLQMVSGSGVMGVEGVIRDSVTNDPIEGALVEIVSIGYEFTTGADGVFSLTGIGANTYNVDVSVPSTGAGPSDYVPQSLPVTVVNGSVATLNFSLVHV